MVASFQERRALEQEARPPQAYQLATVTGVFADGVTLKFDGETAGRVKHYPRNAAVTFTAGQRVRVEKLGGVYVAAYPITGGV